MIRRLGAALIGLALCLPVSAVMPVDAHGPTALTVNWRMQADGDIVGTVTNHTSQRVDGITITMTWGPPFVVASGPVMISSLSPHNASPFHLDAPPAAAGLPIENAMASGSASTTLPTGGLHIVPGSFTGDVYTGTVTNDGAAEATNVRVAAVRVSGGLIRDAKESVTIPTIAANSTADYVITFEAGTSGTVPPQSLIGKTNSGAFYTSWNNYFGDLGATSESFVDEIGWMADEGITTGCGNANFCPRSSVTRGQMAVFLSRALELEDATTDPGFEDDDPEDGVSPTFQQAIWNLATAGITAGCSTDPMLFCPNESVTRGQMSKFIVVGYGLTPIPGTAPFTDDNGHFSEPYNNRMAVNGITSGCGTNLFCPHASVLREQMAVFLFHAENP